MSSNTFQMEEKLFSICPTPPPPPLKGSEVSIIPPEKKRKSSNLLKEGRASEEFEAPITSNYHFSLSTW